MATYDKPLRLRIQMALCDALKEITPGNGYVNDLSGTGKATKVFRGRSIFGEGDPLPMVSILEPPLPLEQLPRPDGSSSNAGPWEVIIQGFSKDDKTNPTDPAHFLAADVMARLAVEKRRETTDQKVLGFKKIRRLILGSPVVRPPDDIVSAKAYFWVSISIDFAENFLNAYEDN